MLGLALGALEAFSPARAAAQGMRVLGVTSVRYLELRPMVDDSVPIDSSFGEGPLRETTRGVRATCIDREQWCRYKRTADTRLTALPFTQDLEATTWGLAQGLQGYVNLRVRASGGNDETIYPQADEAVSLIAAYLDWDRSRLRARVGRQYRSTGLGYVNFDGAAAELRTPWAGNTVSIDAWAGRNLVAGLHEPVTSGAISAVEPLAPQRVGVLLGAQARWRPGPGTGVNVTYQRDMRADQWLYSDRVAADASARLGYSGSVDASIAYDLATGDVNEALLRAQHTVGGPLARAVGGRLAAHGELRRYSPFFPLWTIWGAFTPVGYSEVGGGLAWASPASNLTATVDANWRKYDDTHTGIDVLPMKSDGWLLAIGTQWQATPMWVAEGAFRTEIGFGAARTDGEVGVRWRRGDHAWLGALATVFQSVLEFKVGTGRVAGFGLDGGLRLRDDLRAAGNVAIYQHVYGDLAPATNWSQRRASIWLEWAVGSDPGLSVGKVGGR